MATKKRTDTEQLLIALNDWWTDGDAPLHPGALLFEDQELTVKEMVARALCERSLVRPTGWPECCCYHSAARRDATSYGRRCRNS